MPNPESLVQKWESYCIRYKQGVIREGARVPSFQNFREPKRKSDRVRESQAITDCFFSHVTNFFLNREKTFDKPRENVSILKEFFVLSVK